MSGLVQGIAFAGNLPALLSCQFIKRDNVGVLHLQAHLVEGVSDQQWRGAHAVPVVKRAIAFLEVLLPDHFSSHVKAVHVAGPKEGPDMLPICCRAGGC